MKCIHCSSPIPQERAEIFNFCINCSKVEKSIGFMDYGHKTAPSLVLVKSNDKEAVRRAQRCFRRSR